MMRTGKIKDRLMPYVAGVGYMGLGSYPYNHPLYGKFSIVWRNMLNRCYNPNEKSYKSYGAKGVTVDPRWHNYSLFCEDIKLLPGYNEEEMLHGNLQLDKDKMQQSTNIASRAYAKETCCFISAVENTSLCDYSSRLKNIKVTYPDGEVETVQGFKKFIKDHKLDMSTVYKCLRGKYTSTKGYKFERIV